MAEVKDQSISPDNSIAESDKSTDQSPPKDVKKDKWVNKAK